MNQINDLIHYSFQTFGNLEFALGPGGLASFLQDAHFDAVSTNLNVSHEPVLQELMHKSVVKSFNGELVGIVGYTFQRANQLALVGKFDSSLVIFTSSSSIMYWHREHF